jgi:hypothetical protein
MHKDLIVAIFAENGNSRAFGTGYPVAEDLILTSRHVVRPGDQDATTITVKWFYDKPATGEPQWTKADLIWTGTDDLDAALLRSHRPNYLRRFAVGRLVERRPVEGERWQSAGFARANKRDDVREPGKFGGILREMAEGDSFFELIEDAKPDAKEQWKGTSGMPVFAGSDLLGVVKHVPPNFDHKKLEAVPVWRLLKDAGFRKALGLDEQHERLERARKLLIRLLEDSEAVTRDLATALNVSCGELVECRQQVVERLLTETLERLFELALLVQERRRGKKDRAGMRVAVDLTLAILPAIYEVAVVSNVRRCKGDAEVPIIALPTKLDTLAEIIMAGADRRVAELLPMRSEDYFPEGKYNLPEPLESGRDADGRQFSCNWRDNLIMAFDDELDRFQGAFQTYLKERFIQSNLRSKNAGNSEKELLNTIAKRLHKKAHAKNGSLTYYFIARMPRNDEARKKREDVLAELKWAFPDIAFLQLAGTEDLDVETDRYSELCNLLYESQRTEN